jgi:hypothetical protein
MNCDRRLEEPLEVPDHMPLGREEGSSQKPDILDLRRKLCSLGGREKAFLSVRGREQRP